MHKRNSLFNFPEKQTFTFKVNLEGISSLLSFLGIKKDKYDESSELTNMQLKTDLMSVIKQTYGNLQWAQENLKTSQRLPIDLIKRLSLNGKMFDTPLQTLQEGFKIEKNFFNKYKNSIIDIDKKVSDVTDTLETALTNRENVSTFTVVQVEKLLHDCARQAESIKMVFTNSSVGPDWFGGERLKYSDVGLESVQDISGKTVTAQDIVSAAQFIIEYWFELSEFKEFADDLEATGIDYHVIKWVNNLGVEENKDLDILYDIIGDGGEFSNQTRFFIKQLDKMESLIIDVSKWLQHITNH